MINFFCSNYLNKPHISKSSATSKNHYSEIKPMSSDNVSFAGGDVGSKFVSSFKKLNISEVAFVKKCLKAEELGCGTFSTVYDIPMDGFEDYVMKVSNDFNKKSIAKLEKVKNYFPHRNFGQPVAKMGEDISILRRSKGLTLHNSLDFVCSCVR
ncbi:MAG: hypothetical protein WCF95_06320, partial [bacterium]